MLAIHNPYNIKIRPDKQIAEVLGFSRSKVKKLVEQGEIRLEKSSPQFISVIVNNYLLQTEKNE